MDWSFVLNILSELAYLLIVFGIMWFITVFRGRQAMINIIFGLYLALLISLEFPFYDVLGQVENSNPSAGVRIALFLTFTVLATWLASRIMPDEFQENKLETMGKKIVLALAGTVLIMIFSFQVLPITDWLTPGTPLQALFAPEGYFFWWLLLPLVILFFI